MLWGVLGSVLTDTKVCFPINILFVVSVKHSLVEIPSLWTSSNRRLASWLDAIFFFKSRDCSLNVSPTTDPVLKPFTVQHNGGQQDIWSISNFRRVVDAVFFLLGDSPACELYLSTFRNSLSVPLFWNVHKEDSGAGESPKRNNTRYLMTD